MNFIDLHTDFPLKLSLHEKSAAEYKNHPFENYIQNSAIWIDDDILDKKGYYDKCIYKLKNYIKENEINIVSLENFSKNGMLLSVENASFLAEYPEYIDRFKEDKISIVSLTWNGDNKLAGGAAGNSGLTEIGEDVLKKLNKNKFVIDISHLNEKSAEKVIEAADFVAATHSNCKSVFGCKRNLSEKILLKIKEKNGLIGLCFYPEFLGGGNVFEKIRDNIVYLINLGLYKNICIGSDFDGAEMDENLQSNNDIYALYQYLGYNKIKKHILDRIFYENAIAFFEGICKNIK